MMLSPSELLFLLPDPPALEGQPITARVRLEVRTVPVSPVRGRPRVSAGGAPGPHTGASRLPPGVEQLPGHPDPVPADSPALLGAPVPAALRLAPLHVAGREHVLLHVVLIPLLLSRGEPALQVPPVLRGLPSCGEVTPSKDADLPVVAGVELGPVLQAEVVGAGQVLHVVHQAGGVELPGDEGPAGVAACEEAVAAARSVVLLPSRHVVDLA